MEDILRVGDTVRWRGAWGMDAPQLAKVISLEETSEPRMKEGRSVNSLPWSRVRANYAVVSLDNNRWAYGEQLEPLSDADSTYQTFVRQVFG